MGSRSKGVVRLVEVAHERLHPAVVVHDFLERLRAAQVAELHRHARVQERQFAQPVLQRLAIELDGLEGLQRRQEGYAGARLEGAVLELGRGAGDGQRRHRIAVGEAHLVDHAAAPDLQVQMFGQGVDHAHAHAVQAAGDLVGVLVEFSAGVQLGHDDLGGGDAFVVHVGGDTAAVVGDGDRAVGVQRHLDQRRPSGQGLVHGVVDHLIDHVVQARAVVGVADVHARTLAHRVQALQHLDRVCAVVLGAGVGLTVFGLVYHLNPLS